MLQNLNNSYIQYVMLDTCVFSPTIFQDFNKKNKILKLPPKNLNMCIIDNLIIT